MRVGLGYDVHPLVPGRPLILGGVTIPHDRGLAGHSDADVLCHAIGDALLGAANLGDLGQHFPDQDQQFSNISSLRLLAHIAALLLQHEYRIANIDATIVLESPKVMRHAALMKENIAAALRISATQVSIKATTSEQLGFIGRKKAPPPTPLRCLNKAHDAVPVLRFTFLW